MSKVVPPSAKLPADQVRRVAAARLAGAASAPVTPRLDVDRDGISDLLVRGLDDSLYLKGWKQDKNLLYETPRGGFRDLIEPGDVDGDGHPELLVLSPSGTLTLESNLTESGWGTFGVVPWSENGWNIYNKLFVPGDVTGDNKNDLLARTPSGDLYLYTGTGNLASPYASRGKVGPGWNMFDQLVGVGDVNGDGRGDAVARMPSGDLYFYAGTGLAADPLKARVKIGSGWDGYNQLLAMDDSTGHVDLLARDVFGALWLYPFDATGALGTRVRLGEGWEGATLANSGGNPFFGKNELIGRDSAGQLNYYLPKGDGQLNARQPMDGDMSAVGLEKLSSASSLDNTSRWSTLTLVGPDGHLTVGFRDVGGGWNVMTAFAGIGDASGDGNGDLLARDSNGHLWLYPGNGDSAFSGRIDIGGGWNIYDKLVGGGDVNGDGLPDLLARDTSGHLWLYPGNGRANFGDRVDIGGGWNAYSLLAVPGDITGDGRADLIGVDASGTAWRYDANGMGNFKGRVGMGSGWNMYKALY
ncbi:VCBS repeat-containing protein [Streptomyces sp. BPTC-684]|uniref:FG-GAP repeat domain-containing protein n=1 Tax=Streptomyces sp. BPTC-684 TaxID=3043734 RepID=UPI0024B0724F|nr:VCBS repeat-containing protein [Streptomyces sp. BPTC-684]WHM36534.1 VCBS repeat-containing protein [Streptomyces sp. BPTC-684]